MNEIKFRYRLRWIENSEIVFRKFTIEEIEAHTFSAFHENYEILSRDRFMGFYAGVFGEEVYENDIIKVAHGRYREDTDPNHDDTRYPDVTGQELFLVGYNNCSWTQLRWGNVTFRPLMTKKEYKPYGKRKKYKPFFRTFNDSWAIEVIGNKHEHEYFLNKVL